MEDQYPSLSARMQSIFIDTIFIIILMIVISFVLDRIPGTPDWLRIALFFGLVVFYEPFCVTFYCTVGNYIKGIRVKKFNDTNLRIGLLHSLLRYFLKLCLGWISFITVHLNPSKRAIHDLGSGSVMINFHKDQNNQLLSKTS